MGSELSDSEIDDALVGNAPNASATPGEPAEAPAQPEPQSTEPPAVEPEKPAAEVPEAVKLAEEAIAAVEEPDVEALKAQNEQLKQQVLDTQSVVGGFRREVRDLNSQMQAAQAPAPAVEQSPLDKRAAELQLTPDEVQIDGALYRQMTEWRDEQTQAQSEVQRNNLSGQGLVNGIRHYDAARMGTGLDFESLTALGTHLLSAGDRLDIQNAGLDSGKLAYSKLTNAILQTNGPEAQTLRSRIAARRSQQIPQTRTENKGAPPAPQEESDEREALSAHTASIMNQLRMLD